MTLKEELAVIDEQIAKLESRRTEIINVMDCLPKTTLSEGTKVIHFPAKPRVTVRESGRTTSHIW
jgi:hypothetical protein